MSLVLHFSKGRLRLILGNILALIAAVAVGVGQVLLDTVLFTAMFTSKAVRGVLALLIKLAVYALGFFILFKLFKAFIKVCAVGFAIGFFPCLIIYALKRFKDV